MTSSAIPEVALTITSDQGDYIDAEFLPDTITLKDPSKLKQHEVVKILNHWKHRIEGDEVGLKFKHCFPDHARVVSRKGLGIKKGKSKEMPIKMKNVDMFGE